MEIKGSGCKTKLLWQDSEYLKMQSLAHKGQQSGHKFKKGNSPWNKGLTKETDERVAKNAEASMHKKKPMNKKYHKQKVDIAKKLWQEEEFRKKQSDGLKKNYKENYMKRHADAVRAGKISFQTRKNNFPYKMLGISFRSRGEQEIAKYLLEKHNLVVENRINCNVPVDKYEIDFFLFNVLFLEYHPLCEHYHPGETTEEYYKMRRDILDKNNYENYPLIVVTNVRCLKNILYPLEVKD